MPKKGELTPEQKRAALVKGGTAALAGAAMLATQSTVTATITVPYTIGDQTGQVVVSKEIQVPTVTQTVTVTTTTPTETAPPPPPRPAAGPVR